MNIVIIGCGRISRHHCRAIKKNKKLKLIAVCDLNHEIAKSLANDQYVNYYTNYYKMFSEIGENIDVVVIATPSGMHFDHTMEIMSKFKKDIIVEKPTFMIPSQVSSAFKYAKNNNLNIFPVFQNRYNKAVSRVKKAILNEELGKINIVNIRVRWCRPQRYYDMSEWRGTYSHDGGVLTNQGIHHLDLLRYLGGEIQDVNCRMSTYGSKIEVEDTALSIFSFENGALGSFEITTSARPDDFEASISFVGSKGLIQIGGIAVNELQIFTPNPSECSKYSEDYSDFLDSGKIYGKGHEEVYKQIENFYYYNKSFPIDYNDCYSTIKLLNSLYYSDEIKNTVKITNNFESSRLGKPNKKISNLYTTQKTIE